jgi:hypothetical protein
MKRDKPRFWNNDLREIIFDFHNKFHFFLSILGGFVLGFIKTYAAGILWECKDGIGPWWDDPKWKHYNTDPSLKAWLIANLWMSNKFSFQDAFVWDLGGAIIGAVLRWAALYFGVIEGIRRLMQ